MPDSAKKAMLFTRASVISLLLINGLLALWWGNYPSDHTFQLLRTARIVDLVNFASNGQPLYLILLNFLDNTATLTTVLALATLGRLVLLHAFWQLIYPYTPSLEGQLIAGVGVFLLLLHPAQATAVGSGATWIAAIALYLLRSRRDWHRALLAVLLLALWLDGATVVLIWLSLGWHYRKWRAMQPFTLVVGLLGSGLLGWLWWQNGWGGAMLGSAEIITILQQYLYESDFYLLAIPLLLIGLLYAYRYPPLLIWLIWSIISLLSVQAVGNLQVAIASVWLLVIALRRVIKLLKVQQWIEWDHRVPALFIGIIGLCLALGSLISLRFRHQLRPVALFAAEEQARDYLLAQDIPLDRVAASARLNWLLAAPAQIIWQQALPHDLSALLATPPDVLVLPQSHWQHELENTEWIKWRFRPLHTIHQTNTSLNILKKAELAIDTSPPTELVVTTTFGLHLQSIQIAPQSIVAGGGVNIQLNWLPTTVITPFGSILNITHPIDGTPYAQIDTITPYNISNTLIEAGQLVPSWYQMTTVPEIPVGAYPLTLFLRKPSALDPQPLFKAGESNELDRVTVGYVAVPWQGEMRGGAIDAAYADGILLRNGEVLGEAMAGGIINVSLFWQTHTTPTENYTIFLHFLDAEGNFVAGSDSVPFGGRYPTRGWHPGDTIPSEHVLTLPDELPAGTYRVKVGLYLPSTGERLLATAADGSQSADRSILLQEFIVP